MSNIEKAIKNLKEIADLSREEINKQDKNATVTLDIEDITSVDIVLKELNNSISKDKVKAKIEEIDKEYNEILSNKKTTLAMQNYNANRHEAMTMILEELLESEDKDA